jgi:hypothetical protein
MNIAIPIAIMASVVLGIVGLVVLLLWWLNRGLSQPRSAPAGCTVSVITETVLFVIAAAVMFTYCTTSSSGGLLLELDELRPVFARVYLTLAGALLLLLIASLICVLRKRTALGVCMAFTTVCGFMFISNGPFDLLRRIVNLF